jgi:hypothetical protein
MKDSNDLSIEFHEPNPCGFRSFIDFFFKSWFFNFYQSLYSNASSKLNSEFVSLMCDT